MSESLWSKFCRGFGKACQTLDKGMDGAITVLDESSRNIEKYNKKQKDEIKELEKNRETKDLINEKTKEKKKELQKLYEQKNLEKNKLKIKDIDLKINELEEKVKNIKIECEIEVSNKY